MEPFDSTRAALGQAEAQGVRWVTVADVRGLVDQLEAASQRPQAMSDGQAQALMEKYKADLNLWVAQHQHANNWMLENFRSVVLIGQAALKSAILINGGAAAALLAFIGHLSTSTTLNVRIGPFANATLCFVFGVLLAAIAAGGTYISQHAYSFPTQLAQRIGKAFQVAVVLLVLGAYALFGFGALKAYAAFG